MIWAILAFFGVPLWLCVLGIAVTIVRHRKIHGRPGNIAVRVMRPGKERWSRGDAIWVSDVFAWRGNLANWNEDLVQVTDVTLRTPTAEEQHKLRRVGDDLTIATLTTVDGAPLDVAVESQERAAIVGPFRAPSEIV